MSAPDRGKAMFARALRALGPYLDELVVVLYIHDTLLLLSYGLDDLGALWRKIEPALRPSARRALTRRRADLLATVTDPVRNAAVIAKNTSRLDPPSPDRLLDVCRAGLAQIFG